MAEPTLSKKYCKLAKNKVYRILEYIARKRKPGRVEEDTYIGKGRGVAQVHARKCLSCVASR